MSHSNLLRRLLGGIIAVVTVATITFSGCTKIDNSLGSNLTLDKQSIKLGQMTINGSEGNFFESRLYITDSINSANTSYGHFGLMGNDTFGTRSAGFYTQYVVANALEDDVFGYMPIFDSAVLYLSVEDYGGDTTISQRFEVFEVVDDSFFEQHADTTFFPSFDVKPYIADQPVFTFTFPDVKNSIFVSSTSIRMQETSYTADFIKRLMLEEETEEYDKKIYEDQEQWVEHFKGLYIRPVAQLEPIAAGNPGAIYATKLESSGFGFYGRSREQNDSSLIKDTIGMSYSFYSTYAKHGNVSVNMFENNYDGSMIDLAKVRKADEEAKPEQLTNTLRIEGMAGVVSEITITEEILKELDTILDGEQTETGNPFESLFFNQAKLMIYMEGINGYEPSSIDPYVITPWLNYFPTNLGLYTDYSLYNYKKDGIRYSSLEGVADYMYTYESSQTLDYGGELNRSWGCYVLNIPGQMQLIWNDYLKAKEKAEESGEEIDWESQTNRTIYLAPIAASLFSTKYASLQAGDTNQNSAPMRMELTYTMIK